MRHTLLLCLLIGCGIAQEDFPDEAAEAWCKRADKCGELPDGQDRDECQAAVSASVEAPPLDGGSWTHLCVVVSEEGVSIAVDGTFVAQTRSSVGD